MPASRRSLDITDTYRERTGTLRDRAAQVARTRWAMLDPADLDTSHAAWRNLVIPAATALQRAAATLSGAYLAAYVASERRERPTTLGAAPAVGVGVSRAGKPLDEALLGSLIATKVAIGEGRAPDAALKIGLYQATRSVGEDVMFVARSTLFAGMEADARIAGWRRVVAGTCGACLAADDGTRREGEMHIHENCQCVSEPVVDGVDDEVRRQTGDQRFAALSEAEQDALLGRDKADLIRTGQAKFADLAGRSKMEAITDHLTETPLVDLPVAPRPLAGTRLNDEVAVLVDGKPVKGTIGRVPDDAADPRRIVNVGTAETPQWVEAREVFDPAITKSQRVGKPQARPVEIKRPTPPEKVSAPADKTFGKGDRVQFGDQPGEGRRGQG